MLSALLAAAGQPRDLFERPCVYDTFHCWWCDGRRYRCSWFWSRKLGHLVENCGKLGCFSVFGGIVAGSLLFLIEIKIMRPKDRNAAARKWVPVLIGLMAGAFMAYMAMKGLKKIWKPDLATIIVMSIVALVGAWAASVPSWQAAQS